MQVFFLVCTADVSNPKMVKQDFGKGQLISECIFDNLKFSKKPTKNLTNFCPRIFPLAAIKKMGIKDIGIFNGTFSHNRNGKKFVN